MSLEDEINVEFVETYRIEARRDLTWWERLFWHIPLLKKIVIRRLMAFRGRFTVTETFTDPKQQRTDT